MDLGFQVHPKIRKLRKDTIDELLLECLVVVEQHRHKREEQQEQWERREKAIEGGEAGEHPRSRIAMCLDDGDSDARQASPLLKSVNTVDQTIESLHARTSDVRLA